MTSIIATKLIERFLAFRADEDGAATVDFVVLTSAVVLMGLAHVKDIADASVEIAGDIDVCLANDVAAIMDGNPEDYIQNLQTAGAACSAR